VSCDVNPESWDEMEESRRDAGGCSWELLLRVTGAEADVIALPEGARVPVDVA